MKEQEQDRLFRKCPSSSEPSISFGGLQSATGGNDERTFLIGQKEWEQLPLSLKEIILGSKYQVEIYLV